MGSLGAEVAKRKAMWLYPKALGFNPSERWGHTACCSNGVVYVFGGCCGGHHFSDVLTLDLKTMVWSSLVTTGQKPGTRDSHSAVLLGHRMIVLGGTNGSKKVNDLYMLDLRTREWTRPICEGTPPSPRESHSATVIGDDKLVIFGGSGEGDANYLNDVHILNLKTMTWIAPHVKGELPVPRDSHTAVAVENKLIVYGGDCGDRYHGEVDVLDMETLTWSRLVVQGSSPGIRAGHAAVNIGSKVYVIGGVGDKHYYNDVWVLDLNTCSWSQLNTCGQSPQGRFSHSAVVAYSDVAIYGGCGEDERPLSELLILQLGAEHPNGRYNISLSKMFGSHWNQEKRRSLGGVEQPHKNVVASNGERNYAAREVKGEANVCNLDNLNRKRRRITEIQPWEEEFDQEEHSRSVSLHSSSSVSDQEQVPVHKLPPLGSDHINFSPPLSLLKKQNQSHDHQSNHIAQSQLKQSNQMEKSYRDFHFASINSRRQPKTEQFIHAVHAGKTETHSPRSDQKMPQRLAVPPLIGAEVRGTVDGAFDSGYLMTATVNGQILRGVLFSPGPGAVGRALVPQTPSPASPVVVAQPCPNPHHAANPPCNRSQPPQVLAAGRSDHHAHLSESPQMTRATSGIAKHPKVNGDLQGLVLTLGGCHGGS